MRSTAGWLNGILLIRGLINWPFLWRFLHQLQFSRKAEVSHCLGYLNRYSLIEMLILFSQIPFDSARVSFALAVRNISIPDPAPSTQQHASHYICEQLPWHWFSIWQRYKVGRRARLSLISPPESISKGLLLLFDQLLLQDLLHV